MTNRIVGCFPDRASLIRLVGAVLAEQHDEWTEMRRYIGLDVLAKSRLTHIDTPTTTEEVTMTAITAKNHQTRSRGDRLTHHARGRDRGLSWWTLGVAPLVGGRATRRALLGKVERGGSFLLLT